MRKKKVFIYRNDTDLTKNTYEDLVGHLDTGDFEIADEYSPDLDLLFCIGGDGTFLHFIQNCDFPYCPILGINTGHLGFFQEVSPDAIEDFLQKYKTGSYTIQNIFPVKALIHCDSGVYTHTGLNEVMIRGHYTHITHFNVEMDNTLIQKFSGDGILFSTPVGSTAYNYSLGGSIAAPNLDVLQMTPVAPSNTNAYRCFHSSIMYPAERKVTLVPTGRAVGGRIWVAYDGLCEEYDKVNKIEIMKSEKKINIIRSYDYNYWAKLTAKLL